MTGSALDHLPYGVFSTQASAPRVGVRYGDTVSTCSTVRPELDRPTLNDFMALGPGAWAEHPGRDRRAGRGRRPCRRRRSTRSRCTCPSTVGDYVDFYASLDHASNVGRIFRPDQEPLLPELAAPAGRLPRPRRHRRGQRYAGHPAVRTAQGAARGRADVRPEPAARHRGRARLRGRRRRPSSAAGSRSTSFAEHVFGVVGLNDWSRPRHPGLGVRAARAVPRQVVRDLGERLGHTARGARRGLDRPARPGPGAARVPRGGGHALDIDVEVVLNGEVVSRPPYRTMYWSPAQMLAHLTVNGASHAHRRPVRLRHDQRSRARTSAARSSS